MTGKNEIEIPFTKPELSIHECRSILSQNGEQYTDEEIKKIRSLILHFVEIDFRHFHLKRNEGAKVIDISTNSNNEYRKAG